MKDFLWNNFFILLKVTMKTIFYKEGKQEVCRFGRRETLKRVIVRMKKGVFLVRFPIAEFCF